MELKLIYLIVDCSKTEPALAVAVMRQIRIQVAPIPTKRSQMQQLRQPQQPPPLQRPVAMPKVWLLANMHNIHSIMLQRLLRVILKERHSPRAPELAVQVARAVVHQLDIRVAIPVVPTAATQADPLAVPASSSSSRNRTKTINIEGSDWSAGALKW